VNVCDINTADGHLTCTPTTTGISSPFGITVSGTKVYIGSGSGPQVCSTDVTGNLIDCTPVNVVMPALPIYRVVAFRGTNAYITAGNDLQVCDWDSTSGEIAGCSITGLDVPNFKDSITLVGNYAYVSTFKVPEFTGQVYVCAIDEDGTLQSCQDSGATGVNITQQMAAFGSLIWLTSWKDIEAVVVCSINDETGLLSDCIDSVSRFFLS
jgi:hypothetical protein